MARLADSGDVGDADKLDFGSVADHGDGFDVDFLLNHEVVVLLEKVAATREANGEEAGRIRTVQDFNKRRVNCGEGGVDAALQAFCQSVRGKLQNMKDSYSEVEDDEDAMVLHPYEIAALVNLIDTDLAEDPTDPASKLDECLTIVPSLGRFSEEFLVKEVLSTLKRERDELKLGPDQFALLGSPAGDDDGVGGDEGYGGATMEAPGDLGAPEVTSGNPNGSEGVVSME
mmetsp:Transcript_68292/g.154512  ORF Transcript_68292/g.154512 Transcript_68292/m.154512 type:complete len:229 (+) Transcript_68292:65-751(+)